MKRRKLTLAKSSRRQSRKTTATNSKTFPLPSGSKPRRRPRHLAALCLLISWPPALFLLQARGPASCAKHPMYVLTEGMPDKAGTTAWSCLQTSRLSCTSWRTRLIATMGLRTRSLGRVAQRMHKRAPAPAMCALARSVTGFTSRFLVAWRARPRNSGLIPRRVKPRPANAKMPEVGCRRGCSSLSHASCGMHSSLRRKPWHPLSCVLPPTIASVAEM